MRVCLPSCRTDRRRSTFFRCRTAVRVLSGSKCEFHRFTGAALGGPLGLAAVVIGAFCQRYGSARPHQLWYPFMA